MKQKTAIFLIVLGMVTALAACKKPEGVSGQKYAAADSGQAAPLSAPLDISDAFLVEPLFLQGTVSVVKDGKEVPLGLDTRLEMGDIIRSGADGSAELMFDSMALVRLLPSSELELKRLVRINPDAENRHDLLLDLVRGAVFASAVMKNPGDEFLIGTPNSITRIRGTRYMVSYEPAVAPGPGQDNGRTGRTTLAVEEGEVRILPRAELISEWAGYPYDSPPEDEYLFSAFGEAPAAGPGEELVIGGAIGKAAAESEKKEMVVIEAAYAGLTAEGTLTEETRRILRDMLSRFHPGNYGPSTAFLMEYMDFARDPDTAAESIPAALPREFFPAYGESREYPRAAQAKPEASFPAMEWNTRVSNTNLADAISRSGGIILVIAKNGRVTGIDENGRIAWTFSDGASGMSGLDESVALTTKDAFVILDGSGGTVQAELPFTAWASMPNTKPVPVPEGVALATPRGVAICRQGNAQILREIPVSGGIISTLVLADKELAGINGAGNLVIMNISAGSIRLEVPLALGQEILSPRYLGGRMYIANKSGRIVAVDVESGIKIWDRDFRTALSIEPELDAERLYVWTAEKTLLRISTADGSSAGAPLPNVESAPLLSSGKLYWGGRGGTLVVADPATGKILKTNPIPDSASVRPLMVGDNLYVGTQGGRLIKVRGEFL